MNMKTVRKKDQKKLKVSVKKHSPRELTSEQLKAITKLRTVGGSLTMWLREERTDEEFADSDTLLLIASLPEEEGKIVGWLMMRRDDRNKTFDIMIYVQIAYRRKGIGRKLINRSIREAKKRSPRRRIHVYVFDENEAFFKKMKLA
jgi:ribosomal protein S18 acetylase RimI-like enzyme